MRWAYGVTTVPARLPDLLPRTLESLAAGGFDAPRLFVDGAKEPAAWEPFGLDVTCRYPKVRTAGNWVLSMVELYIRNPAAERYAIFQDDMVCYRNLRQYLEKCKYPDKGYLNLYTFPQNHDIAPRNGTRWFLSNQRGWGALALVFSRDAVVALLSAKGFVLRPQSVPRAHAAIDGGIVTELARVGWKEWCHNPSLVQHTGRMCSQTSNKLHPLADAWYGEEFDALELLR